MRIKGVLFDLDGTLLDSKEAIVASFKKTAKILGISLDERKVRRLIGIPSREIIKAATLTQLSEEIITAFVRLRRQIFEEIWRKEVQLYPDVIPTLERLQKRGFLLGIVSSNISSRLKAMVSYFNLNKYMSVVVGYEGGMRPKPYPDMILFALRKLNLTPDEVIYVGDSEQDYMSAKNAGTLFIMVDREGKYTQAPFPIIKSLFELLSIMNDNA